MNDLINIFNRGVPLIGVVHLLPLPGYADSPGIEGVITSAFEDLESYRHGGISAALIENENDRPYTVAARPETIAAMTRAVRELSDRQPAMVIGCEILLNDPVASLATAKMGGGRFIRTDYFVDRMSRPEYGGEMAIDPDGLVDYRSRLGADDLAILADIQVKHALPVVTRSLTDSAQEAAAKRADAIIVTGSQTGLPPSAEDLELAKKGAGNVPVLVGSGVSVDNAGPLLGVADGAVVGSSLMESGRVVAKRVRELVATVRRIHGFPEPGRRHGG